MFGANLDENHSIIDMKRYNGRVNILEVPDNRFQMAEKIALKNKSTEYRDPVYGIWECNVLSNAFFSENNVQIIQNGLRAGVYAMSKEQIVVPPQNIDQLKIIMRSIYLQNAQHSETVAIPTQVDRLNKMVLEYAVSSVYKEAVGYLRYCKDQSSLVVPLDRPTLVDRDYKTLELKPWI